MQRTGNPPADHRLRTDGFKPFIYVGSRQRPFVGTEPVTEPPAPWAQSSLDDADAFDFSLPQATAPAPDRSRSRTRVVRPIANAYLPKPGA